MVPWVPQADVLGERHLYSFTNNLQKTSMVMVEGLWKDWKGQQEMYFWHFIISKPFLIFSHFLSSFPFSFLFFFLVYSLSLLHCTLLSLNFLFLSYFDRLFPHLFVFLPLFSHSFLVFFSIFEFLSTFQPMRRLSCSWPTVGCTESWRPSTMASPWSAFLYSSTRWAKENMHCKWRAGENPT